MTLGPVPRTGISLLIVAAGVSSIFLLGEPEVVTRPANRGAKQVVLTTSAEAHTDGIPFDVDGVVVPYRQIEIAAEVSGRISFKDEN